MTSEDPTGILVTEEYFPVYTDECGTANDKLTTPDHLEGVTYETTQDAEGNFTTTLTADDGHFLLVEGGQVVFERPAFTDIPCEGTAVPTPGDQLPGGELPATGVDPTMLAIAGIALAVTLVGVLLTRTHR